MSARTRAFSLDANFGFPLAPDECAQTLKIGTCPDWKQAVIQYDVGRDESYGVSRSNGETRMESCPPVQCPTGGDNFMCAIMIG